MGKGHRRCEVCGVKEARPDTENKLLFSKFPLDPNRCREWIKAVGNEELVHLPIEKLHEQRSVCANHFGKKELNKNGNRLKRHAIPTLNLLALPLTDGQLAEFPQHIYRHSESKEDGTMQDDVTAMQFHVPVEFLDVQENIEITLEAPIQLEQGDSLQLDPELLPALGDTMDEQPIYGENIHHTLAQRWIPLLKKGLAKDFKKKIFKEYRIPENCKLLRAPILNPEIKAAVSKTMINRDKNMQLKQDQLGLGISVLNNAITQLLVGDDKIQAIKILSDSCRILTDLHYTETQARTKLITPSLDKSLKPLIKDHERDETLFGEKLSETIRASKVMERQRSLIQKSAQRKKTTGPRASPSKVKHRAQTRR